ncbi:MAG: hypothetical protein AAGA55_03260 [Planctomycetota bacterium]
MPTCYRTCLLHAVFCGLVSGAAGAYSAIDPATLAPPAAADSAPTGIAYAYDLSGVNSWDAAGSANNEILSLDVGVPNRFAVRMSWDVSIQTVGSSWLSEVTIGFLDSPIGLQLAPGTDDAPGTGTYTSSGIVDLAALDPTFPFEVGPDGILQMEVFESFDDEAGAIDAVFLPGSTITFYFIPGPGSAVVLCFAAVCATRRRRH